MTQHEVARTLVKSAPELWEVCSDPDSLGRHLEAFGEIRITRVEPETTVAWEGERASGTVRIEPSGWGTRVTLTATAVAANLTDVPMAVTEVAVAATEPETAAEPEPTPQPEPDPAPEPEPELLIPAEPQPEPAAVPRPGFFRRLGGLLFRSLVTPVELPDEAFRAPGAAEATSPEGEAASDPEPVPPAEPELGAQSVESGPETESTPAPVMSRTEPERSQSDLDPGTVLAGVLDRLGSDHHRPFSRG